jgi:glutamate N-acetyltransferase/amino-acid N-acetyltransferase
MSVTYPKGFRANGVVAGLKDSGRPDLALLVADEVCSVAGLFTTNTFPAAPVQLSRARLSSLTAQAVLVNSGQANAGVGPDGDADALASTASAAGALQVDPERVLACSTGIIGERLEVPKVIAAVPGLVAGLSAEGGTAFVEAIMTTDVKKKEARADAGAFRIGGAAKGVGMIEPNLATMLAFVTTDARVSPDALYDLAVEILKPAFESLTVDACTSTNDTVLLFASGAAGNDPVAAGTREWGEIKDGLASVAESLVLQLAADGEGANHVLVVEVEGAHTDRDARLVAKALANSALVKAAAFGGDPNPGRIVQAMGASGASFEPTTVDAWIGEALIVSAGRVPPDYPTSAKPSAQREMKQPQIRYRVRLGDGHGKGRAIGCDLSYDYVKINAEYTN